MRILSLIVALFATTMLSAQRLDYLTLRLTNGAEHSLNIAAGATLTFSASTFTGQANGQQLQLPLADLSALFFAAAPTGIEDLEAAAISARLSSNARIVTAPAGSTVSIYTLDGRQLTTLQKSLSGSERFTLPLSSGIYVVRIGQETFKLLAP